MADNGQALIDALEFREKINKLSGDDLTRFFAEQFYAHCERETILIRRVSALEARDRKVFGYVGGLASFIGTAIGAGILFLYEKLKG